MMKRILVICVIAMTMTTLHAQEYLGVQIGYASPITRLNVPTSNKETLHANAYQGLKLGLVYDATLWKGLGVTMGLNYTFGACRTENKKPSIGLYPQTYSTRQYHQLEIPVDWQYKFEIAKHAWLMLYTGPTLQCGLALNSKNYITYDGKTNSLQPANPTDNYYSADDMGSFALKRMNVTWGLGAGFQYEKYFIRGGYDFGLINPYKSISFGNTDIYTRGRFDQWQVKLGMYLWER